MTGAVAARRCDSPVREFTDRFQPPHVRYVLPLFPFVIIATSKLACFVKTGHMLASPLVGACLLWAVASSLSFTPIHFRTSMKQPAGR